jgi:hypothetical protein
MNPPRKPEIPDREPVSPSYRIETLRMLERWHADAHGQSDPPDTASSHPDDIYQAIANPVRFELRMSDDAHDRPTIQGVIFGSGHVVVCCFTGTGLDGVEVSSHRSFWEALFGLDHLWITWLDTPPSWVKVQ